MNITHFGITDNWGKGKFNNDPHVKISANVLVFKKIKSLELYSLVVQLMPLKKAVGRYIF